MWADLNLNFPLFNAAETTLQQLIQVAGRAGRQSKESTVIVQEMEDHSIFNYLHEIDYLKFYAHEMETRKTVGYPPFRRLVEIELKNTNEETLDAEAFALVATLSAHRTQYVTQCGTEIHILGPAKPPVAKVKNTHSRKLYIKGDNMNELIKLFQVIKRSDYSSQIFFTPNPTC